MIQDSAIWRGLPLTKVWRPGLDTALFRPFFQVSVFCMNEDNEILLVKHPTKGFWMLPGGTPMENESAEETLRREVMEEASCTIDGIELVGAVEMNFPDNPNQIEGDYFFQLRYFARVKHIHEQTPDPDHDICLERKFVSFESFSEYVSYDYNIHAELLILLKNWVK